MKKHVLQLAAIARKRRRTIIGLMSGTSLDGLDVALCQITGAGAGARVEVQAFETVPFDAVFKENVRQVFAKKSIDLQHLTLLNVRVAETHARIVNACLQNWMRSPEEVDLLASHGQTVFHAPRTFHGLPEAPNATLQIGDGDHLALRTGIITLSDFRQKHLAAGGEGAPLALYGDYFLFSKKGEDRFLLNIGGIANFTFLPGNLDREAVFATDTGPGNTLLDAYARQLFDTPFDRDSLLAAAGMTDEQLLALFKKDRFFSLPFPKTTGPEQFGLHWVEASLAQLPKGAPGHNPYNLMATLTRLTADTILEALLRTPRVSATPAALYLSGGGAHNPLLVRHLREALPRWKIQEMATLGVDGDAKEAVLFAMLANETVAGQSPENARLAGLPLVSMGKISFPG